MNQLLSGIVKTYGKAVQFIHLYTPVNPAIPAYYFTIIFWQKILIINIDFPKNIL